MVGWLVVGMSMVALASSHRYSISDVKTLHGIFTPDVLVELGAPYLDLPSSGQTAFSMPSLTGLFHFDIKYESIPNSVSQLGVPSEIQIAVDGDSMIVEAFDMEVLMSDFFKASNAAPNTPIPYIGGHELAGKTTALVKLNIWMEFRDGELLTMRYFAPEPPLSEIKFFDAPYANYWVPRFKFMVMKLIWSDGGELDVKSSRQLIGAIASKLVNFAETEL